MVEDKKKGSWVGKLPTQIESLKSLIEELRDNIVENSKKIDTLSNTQPPSDGRPGNIEKSMQYIKDRFDLHGKLISQLTNRIIVLENDFREEKNVDVNTPGGFIPFSMPVMEPTDMRIPREYRQGVAKDIVDVNLPKKLSL